jgi:hypothetical protein
MANKYVWHGKEWTDSGCPADGLLPKGWYSGYRLIADTYINPVTGKVYTQLELAVIDCPECVVPEPVEPVEPSNPTKADNSLYWIIGIAVVAIALYYVFVR